MLTADALAVLEKRYFLRDSDGNIKEDWDGLVNRVSNAIYPPIKQWIEDLKFIPNSPTLMNAGTGMGTLSACFVLPIEDTMPGIMDAAKDQAMVQKFGGGTGFSLSRIRPKGAGIATTHGAACGPIAVLRHLSSVSKLVTQGGKRDGANMAVLRVDHPDIMEFIHCKRTEGDIHNFNISVGITDDFMRALIVNGEYNLIDHEGKTTDTIKATEVWNEIIEGAWTNGEPGVVFLDQANREHRKLGLPEIEATNPCGEQPLLGNESCNLGSIALSKFIKEDRSGFDYEELAACVHDAVVFLDNVIDSNVYATDAIERATKDTRKIGLGVMGWADALLELGIRYGSEESFRLASEVFQFIQREAERESTEILARVIKAREHNGLDTWVRNFDGRRNACVTTVAPTGTIAMIAGVSYGIEPVFRARFTKQNILEGGSFEYVHPHADSPVFVDSAQVTPEEHVRMQAAFQRWCDSGVSKTINLASNSSLDDVDRAYRLAWTLGCKGITVYRDKSRNKEVLTETKFEPGLTHVEGCSENPDNINYSEGCKSCSECGVAAC